MTSDQNEKNIARTYLASSHMQERREPRYDAKIDIEVSGIDQTRNIIHERTVTTNISEWGCGFTLPIEVKLGDILLVRVTSAHTENAGPARQAMFQVVRVAREEDGWLVGAWKMDSIDVWGGHLEELGRLEQSRLEARKPAAEGSEAPDRESDS